MTNEFWADDPLDSTARDTLGRKPYARAAAKLIANSHSFETSVVFGLSGPWGSGKSSLISMIVEELTAIHPDWSIARFTPWATSDVAGLLSEFYASLAEPLPADKSEMLKKSLGVIARVAAPAAAMVPFVGSVANNAANSLADRLQQAEPWQKAFDEAAKRLRELGVPILMIVDDIDRLQPDELMTLLKVVRLLGRFPGVQYLLAYDDDTLLRTLSTNAEATRDGSAERFVEKIVQYPLLVPPLLEHQQLARLNRGLAPLERQSDTSGRISDLRSCFVALLRTPRAIDRYIAQLHHHLPMVDPDEIDDDDVHLLTLLRVSFPALFNALPRYRSQLITGHTDDFVPGGAGIEWVRFDPTPLLSEVPTQHREVAEQLLFSLFPAIAADKHARLHTSRTQLGVAQEDYFDRYFAMGIPEHDIEDSVVREAARLARHGDPETLEELFAGATSERQLLILGKLAHRADVANGDEEGLAFAGALTGIANDIHDEDLTFSAKDQALALTAVQLARLSPAVTPDQVLDILARLTSNALRIRVSRWIFDELDRRPNHRLPWPTLVSAALADDAVTRIVNNLTQGDAARDDEAIPYQMLFVVEKGRVDQLRDKIGELFRDGAVDLPTLASRLISSHSIVGTAPDWRLSPEVNQQLFDQIAPADDDPWYDQQPETVDDRDRSWPNKKRFAVGRFRRPIADRDGRRTEDTDGGSGTA